MTAPGWTKGKLTEAQLATVEEDNAEPISPAGQDGDDDDEVSGGADDEVEADEVANLIHEIEKEAQQEKPRQWPPVPSAAKDKTQEPHAPQKLQEDLEKQRQQPLLDADDRKEDVNALLLLEEEEDEDVTAMSNAEIEALIDELEAGGFSVDMLGLGGMSRANKRKSDPADILARLEKQFKEIVGGDIHDVDKATDEGDSFIAGLLATGSGGGNEYDVIEEYYTEDGQTVGRDNDENRAAELEARLARIEEMLRLTEEMGGLDDL